VIVGWLLGLVLDDNAAHAPDFKILESPHTMAMLELATAAME